MILDGWKRPRGQFVHWLFFATIPLSPPFACGDNNNNNKQHFKCHGSTLATASPIQVAIGPSLAVNQREARALGSTYFEKKATATLDTWTHGQKVLSDCLDQENDVRTVLVIQVHRESEDTVIASMSSSSDAMSFFISSGLF